MKRKAAIAATTVFLLAPAFGADPAKAGKSPVVTLEAVPGSAVPRVILAAKAAERLGIETGKVGEELVVRRQIVSGLVTPPLMDQAHRPRTEARPRPAAADGPAPPTFGGFARTPAAAPAIPVTQPVAQPAALPVAGEVWVFVALSPVEWERLDKDRPARLLPLNTRDGAWKEMVAQPSRKEPELDTKRLMQKLYYVVPGKEHGLAVNNRVRVELQMAGASDRKQKVVPYGAVLYDAKGEAWVYVNGKPLTFERQRIVIERIVGDMAVLTEGPAVGTPIVTVGAALLYGSEIFKK
jgi:hypothetical protein